MVRGLRISAGLTQEELADRAGLSVRTIRYIEQGQGAATPRLKTVEMLAAALELDAVQTAQLLAVARNSHLDSRTRLPGEDRAPAFDGVAPRSRRGDPPRKEATRADPHVSTPSSASPEHAHPAQLPFAMAELFGREEVREGLNQYVASRLSDSLPALLAITGMPGVGKTALALDWANDRAHSFPDGQLYVDLRGFEESPPMTPSTALHGFLAALGHPADTLPKETHELSGMYRTALAGRRMLIVLDNAQSAEQVRPLLANSPGSVTVVTSRDRLTGLTIRHGALRVDLDCLPKDASLHLLANVVGMDRINAEPEAVATLVSLCGSLPLALHIIGERLVRYPANPISEWVDTMIRNPNRLEGLDIPGDPATSLRAVFSWSYLALPAATARLFRLLGLNDRSEFKISQITRAFVEEKAIEPRLAMLVDSHLLTSPAPGKYRFHKLVHLYARERAEAEESSEYTAEFARRLRRSRRDEPSTAAERARWRSTTETRWYMGGGKPAPSISVRTVPVSAAVSVAERTSPGSTGWRAGTGNEVVEAACPLGFLDSEHQLPALGVTETGARHESGERRGEQVARAALSGTAFIAQGFGAPYAPFRQREQPASADHTPVHQRLPHHPGLTGHLGPDDLGPWSRPSDDVGSCHCV
ncbi:NB-ARC domain-containing protein [Streptomyces sp. NBC_00073]